MLAALAVGLLISVRQQTIGLPFLIAFAAGSVVVTILVEARGLMLTVGQLPLLFGISLPLTAWMINASVSNVPQKLSATTILTLVYPLAQHFPTLGLVTLGCAVIAALRIWQFRRTMGSQARSAERERRKTQEADRTNRETASRARRLSNRNQQDIPPHKEPAAASQRVTVEELQRRASAPEEPPQQPHKRTVQRPRPQQRPAAQQPHATPSTPEQPKRTKPQSPPTMVISPVKASPKTGAHQRPEEDHHSKHERSGRPPQPPRRAAASTEQRDAQRREAQRQRRQQAIRQEAPHQEHPRQERTRQQPQRSGSIRRPTADAGSSRAGGQTGGHDQQRPHKRTVQTPRVQQPQRSSSRAEAHNHSTGGGRYTSRGSESAQARGQRQRDQQQRDNLQQESRQSQQRRQQPRQQPAAYEEQRQPRTVQRRQVRKVQPRRDSTGRDSRRNSRHDDLY